MSTFSRVLAGIWILAGLGWFVVAFTVGGSVVATVNAGLYALLIAALVWRPSS